jgi:hypothetical protein
MTFGEHVFLYCERGTDPGLWAEPLNVISNAGYFLAALIFWQLVLWRPREERSADHYLLVALGFLIGFGSLAFHLYADKGTEIADVVPIALFMLVYLGFALNRFLFVPPGWTVLLVIGFAVLAAVAAQVQCWEGGIGLAGTDVAGAKPCLNGSVGYLPALAALIIVGLALIERHHRAAPYVAWAAVIFAVSIIFRSVDMAFCDQVLIDGREVGTHFIWHLLNAVVLFLLLRASLEAGPVAAGPAEADSEEESPKPPVSAAPVEAVPAKDAPTETPEVASAGEEAAVKAATKDAAAGEAPKAGAKPPEPEASGIGEVEPEAKDEEPAPQKKAAPKGGAKKKPSFRA